MAGLGVEHEHWVEMQTALDLTLTDNGDQRDLITRSDDTSWIDEGFSQGDRIELFDGVTSLGEFTIDEFSEDEFTIILKSDDALAVTGDPVSGLMVEPGWRRLVTILTCPSIASSRKSLLPTIAKIWPVATSTATKAPFVTFRPARASTWVIKSMSCS